MTSMPSLRAERDRLVAQAFLLVGEIHTAQDLAQRTFETRLASLEQDRPLRAAWGLGETGVSSTWLSTSVGTGATNNLSGTRSLTLSAHLRNILSLSQPCAFSRPINAGRS